MPTGLIFHIGHALTLNGVGQDATRLTSHHRGAQSGINGIQIVSVDLIQIKTKGLQLGRQITQRHDLVVAAVDLQTVVINNNGQVVQLKVAGSHKGLPNLTFLALAVTEDGIHAAIFAQLLGTQCHTHSDGATLTERTGGCIHTGNLLAVGMTLQNAVELTEVGILIAADKAKSRQYGIITGSSMALTQHKAVTIGILGILGINAHMVAENAGNQFHHGQGTTGVATACIGDHGDDIAAHLLAYTRKLCRIHGKNLHSICSMPMLTLFLCKVNRNTLGKVEI